MSKRDLFKRLNQLGRAEETAPGVAEVMLTEQRPPVPKAGGKFAVQKKETKSAHMHILLKPSTKAQLDQVAESEGISTNELINEILEYCLKEC